MSGKLPVREEEPGEVDFSKTTRLLLELKDTSELMVDLAYSALLYDNEDIADEIFSLEEVADDLEKDVQLSAMEDLKEHKDVKKGFVLIRLATAMEKIADAAVTIADVVLRDIERNPVVCLSLRDSKVRITTVTVERESILAGRRIGENKIASKSGMWIIAIRKDRKYYYGPDENTMISEGDLLLARGPKEGESILREMARKKRR
ncbi:MAG TPA: PhoU family transcriptional regulator [Euryarchaeota archaeon]|nr:PhoU family transcriptional regulator [Euryarchaeota archaeon]